MGFCVSATLRKHESSRCAATKPFPLPATFDKTSLSLLFFAVVWFDKADEKRYFLLHFHFL